MCVWVCVCVCVCVCKRYGRQDEGVGSSWAWGARSSIWQAGSKIVGGRSIFSGGTFYFLESRRKFSVPGGEGGEGERRAEGSAVGVRGAGAGGGRKNRQRDAERMRLESGVLNPAHAQAEAKRVRVYRHGFLDTYTLESRSVGTCTLESRFMHMHTRNQLYTHIHIHIYTHTYTHTHTQTYTHTPLRAYTCPEMCAYITSL